MFEASASPFGMARTLATLSNTNVNGWVESFYINEMIAGYEAGLGSTPLDLNGEGTIEERAFLSTWGRQNLTSFANGGKVKNTAR